MGCMGEVGAVDQPSTSNQTITGNDDDANSAPTSSQVGTAAEPATQAVACPGGAERPLAAGLRIREIALYQTIKIPLYQGGRWITSRPVSVVQGKQSLARVFVDLLPGYQRRPVRGVLRLTNGATVTELVSERTIAGNSTDQDANSTFSFAVDGALLGPSTQVSAILQEPACGATSTATPADARIPATGGQALNAAASGKLKVVIVPINIGGRVPPTGEKEIGAIRNMLAAYYPVPSVEVTVRAPLRWTGAVAASDQRAWSNVLNAIMRQRGTDRPSSDTYYFGLMQPAPTFTGYCARGCILGIAPMTTRVQTSAQVGLGVYFGDSAGAINQSAETVVHELGHAHGRGHAPCVQGGSIRGVDTAFPDKGGNTAVWGWDARSNALIPPTHKDVMGYCRPNWISAYTYQALFVRSQAVNTQRAFIQGPGTNVRWQNLIAYHDGKNRWGGNAEIGMPGGDAEPANVLDQAGNVIKQIDIVRMPLSHSSDEFFYIPEPGKDWATLQLADRQIALSEVEAPLPD